MNVNNNKNISIDEMEAYFFTHPELNHKPFFEEYTNTLADFLKKDLVCYEDKKYAYVHLYKSGNIAKKIASLESSKSTIEKDLSLMQYEKQKSLLESILPSSVTLTGENKVLIYPTSLFAKNATIRELRYNDVLLNGDTTLVDAYDMWSKKNKGSFESFLENELTITDQERIAKEWSNEYSSTVNVDLSKIPVNADIELSDTQRNAVAMVYENKSGVLCYGYEDRINTLIGCIQQAEGSVLIVCNDRGTDLWIKDINSKMPLGASIVPLGDLNAAFVRNTLKEYSDKNEMAFTLLESEINDLVDDATPEQMDELQRQYNALVYDSGTAKQYPAGTVFLINEKGLDKLNSTGLKFDLVCFDGVENGTYIDAKVKLCLVDDIQLDETVNKYLQESYSNVFIVESADFNGYINVPQLKSVIKSFIDKKTSAADQRGVDKKIITDNTLALTGEQSSLIDGVISDNRVESATSTVELLISLDTAERITVSPYSMYPLQEPSADDFISSSPKLKYVLGCIESVFNYHKDRNEPISGQIVYLTNFEQYFPLIKEYLLNSLGLLPYNVACITNITSEAEKEVILRDYERSKVYVLLGNAALLRCDGLAKNTSTVYNVFHEKVGDEATDFENKICTEGNKYKTVRFVYPQTDSAADRIGLACLNNDRVTEKELWSDSNATKISFDIYSTDELKLELLSDNAEMYVKLKTDKEKETIQEKISFFESKRPLLEKSVSSFLELQTLRPQALQYLHELDVAKIDIYKNKAIKDQSSRLEDIVNRFVDELERNIELGKYTKEKYDYTNDPDKKYVPKVYVDVSDDVLLEDTKYWLQQLATANRDESIIDSSWGSYYFEKDKIFTILSKFEDILTSTQIAQERILSPLRISFIVSDNPLADFDAKISNLKSELNSIEESIPERVEAQQKEIENRKANTSSVEMRVGQFVADNESCLVSAKEESIDPAQEEEILLPSEEETEAFINHSS